MRVARNSAQMKKWGILFIFGNQAVLDAKDPRLCPAELRGVPPTLRLQDWRDVPRSPWVCLYRNVFKKNGFCLY